MDAVQLVITGVITFGTGWFLSTTKHWMEIDKERRQKNVEYIEKIVEEVSVHIECFRIFFKMVQGIEKRGPAAFDLKDRDHELVKLLHAKYQEVYESTRRSSNAGNLLILMELNDIRDELEKMVLLQGSLANEVLNYHRMPSAGELGKLETKWTDNKRRLFEKLGSAREDLYKRPKGFWRLFA